MFVVFCLASPHQSISRYRYEICQGPGSPSSAAGQEDAAIFRGNANPKELANGKDVWIYAVDGGWDVAQKLRPQNVAKLFNLAVAQEVCNLHCVAVGDFDSIVQKKIGEVNLPIGQVVSLACEKDFSDFAAALDLLLEKVGYAQVVWAIVLAGTGGRKDHELVNFAEVQIFVQKLHNLGVNFVVEFLEHSIFFNSPLELRPLQYFQFSLLSLTGASALRVSGARYQGLFRLERPSHGLSNSVIPLASGELEDQPAFCRVCLTPVEGIFQMVFS